MSDRPARILILGGTTEASALAQALAGRDGWRATLSLAGRTSAPKASPVPVRIGGFGGAEGLARYLGEEGIQVLVDATHPFAARISANAASAARRTGVPILAIRRPPWLRVPGDVWTEVADIPAAVEALGHRPRTVFLTIGRPEVAAFAAAPPQAYGVRSIEPLGDALPVPRLTAIEASGPFDARAEAALMRRAGIEVLVSKNAGGAATAGKIAAARSLGLPVVMVRRPHKPDGPSVPDAEGALAWLTEERESLLRQARHRAPPTLRGV